VHHRRNQNGAKDGTVVPDPKRSEWGIVAYNGGTERTNSIRVYEWNSRLAALN
jgi:hypothetical protein